MQALGCEVTLERVTEWMPVCWRCDWWTPESSTAPFTPSSLTDSLSKCLIRYKQPEQRRLGAFPSSLISRHSSTYSTYRSATRSLLNGRRLLNRANSRFLQALSCPHSVCLLPDLVLSSRPLLHFTNR